MKTFNQVITVEVSVDSIANQLINTISESFPHREMLVETIISTGLDKGTLNYLYNSLNGYTNEINFQVGEVVKCSQKVYQYKSENSREENRSEYSEIGECVIVDINIYTSDKVCVEFDKWQREGTTKKVKEWVNHSTLSK